MSETPDGHLTDALDRLAHTARTQRLTPETALRLKHTVEQILTSLGLALQKWGTIKMRVEPFRLMWRGSAVYEQSNRAESLAFRLFRDGVATLSFTPDLSTRQLQHFIELLAIAPELSEQIGEDISTRLWTEPLPSIQITERPMIPRRLLDLIPNPQDLMAEATDALVFFESGVGDTSPVPRVLCPAETLNEQWRTIAGSPSRPDGNITGQPPEPEVSRIATRGALSELSELLRAATLSPESTIDSELLRDLYLGLARAQVGFGEEVPVRQLVRGLRGLHEWCEGPDLTERKTMLDAVSMQIASPESLSQALLNTSSGLSQMDLDWIPNFFAEHNRQPIDDYLPLFGHNLTSSALTLLSRTVWHMAGDNADIWKRVLVQIDGDIAAEALAVPLDHGEDHFVAELAQLALQHDHPALRRTAIEHLPHDRERRTRSMLTDALRDMDATVRLAAIERLGLSGDPSLGIFLVDRVRRMDLMGTPPDEQHAVYLALARLGGDRYLSLLLKQLHSAEERLNTAGDTPQEEAARIAESVLDSIAQMGSGVAQRQLLVRRGTAPDRLLKAYDTALDVLQRTDKTQPPPFAPPRPAKSNKRETPEDQSLTDLLTAYLNEEPSLDLLSGRGKVGQTTREIAMIPPTPPTFNEPHSSVDASTASLHSRDSGHSFDPPPSASELLIWPGDAGNSDMNKDVSHLIDDLMKSAGKDPDPKP